MTARHLLVGGTVGLCMLAVAGCEPGPTPEQRRATEIAEAGAWRKGWQPPPLSEPETDLTKGARTFATVALGAEARSLREVQGIRERAVCGVAGARRFIYREERRPIVEGEYPPAAFQSAVDGWCPAGWPQTP